MVLYSHLHGELSDVIALLIILIFPCHLYCLMQNSLPEVIVHTANCAVPQQQVVINELYAKKRGSMFYTGRTKYIRSCPTHNPASILFAQ